jgi:hypothetical protein
MGRMAVFLDLVKRSRLLAPNLREMTMTLYNGQGHKGNQVAREVVRDHLAALRWMNPNAVIYLREARGQGTPTISYSLCASCPRVGCCGARFAPAPHTFLPRPAPHRFSTRARTHTHAHTPP